MNISGYTKEVYKPCITLYIHLRGGHRLISREEPVLLRFIKTVMACVFPRLDPTLAYPVPLRPSVFQHARFIDKMQPGAARVKQEKYEVYQDEPLKDGMWS